MKLVGNFAKFLG